VPIHSQKGKKYISYDEVKKYYESGKSVILYNHRSMEPREKYKERFLKLGRELNIDDDDLFILTFSKYSVRDYVFVIRQEHRNTIYDAVAEFMASGWGIAFKEWRLRAILQDGMTGGFDSLTKYIGKIALTDNFGEWITDEEGDGSPEHPITLPYTELSALALEFVGEFYDFSKAHPEYRLNEYRSILEKNGLKSPRNAEADSLDAECVLALIMGAISSDRFCEGVLLGCFEEGNILRWLKRLKDIDEGGCLAR
jgi:hypothetical protein